MPRDGSITFGDLVGKLTLLPIRCGKYGGNGAYSIARLIGQHGRDGKLTDWLSTMTRSMRRETSPTTRSTAFLLTPSL